MESRVRVRVQIDSERAFKTKPVFSEYIGSNVATVDEALFRNLERILDTYTSNSVTGDEVKEILEKLVTVYRLGSSYYKDSKYNVGYTTHETKGLVLNIDFKVGFSRIVIDKEEVNFQYVGDGCMILKK